MANKTHPQPTHPAILLSYCILLSGKLKIRRKFYIEQIVFCRGSKAWGIVRAGEGTVGGGSASWLTASLSSQFGIQEDDEQQHEHMKIDCVFGFSFSFVFSLSFGFFLLFYSYFISILARLVRIAAGVCEMYMNFFYWVITDRVTSNDNDTCCIIHLASQYQLGNLMSTTWDLPENFTPKISSAILAPIKRTYKADIVIEILIWAEIA